MQSTTTPQSFSTSTADQDPVDQLVTGTEQPVVLDAEALRQISGGTSIPVNNW